MLLQQQSMLGRRQFSLIFAFVIPEYSVSFKSTLDCGNGVDDCIVLRIPILFNCPLNISTDPK